MVNSRVPLSSVHSPASVKHNSHEANEERGAVTNRYLVSGDSRVHMYQLLLTGQFLNSGSQ